MGFFAAYKKIRFRIKRRQNLAVSFNIKLSRRSIYLFNGEYVDFVDRFLSMSSASVTLTSLPSSETFAARSSSSTRGDFADRVLQREQRVGNIDGAVKGYVSEKNIVGSTLIIAEHIDAETVKLGRGKHIFLFHVKCNALFRAVLVNVEKLEVVGGKFVGNEECELDLAYGLEIYVVPIGINVEKSNVVVFRKTQDFPWPH